MTNTHLTNLLTQWRNEAQRIRKRFGAEQAAKAIESCADDLEATQHHSDNRVLSLSDASLISGYSVEHLGRLIREGKIPNAGRKGKPLIRLHDLPHRPKVETPDTSGYDPVADAQCLRKRGGIS